MPEPTPAQQQAEFLRALAGHLDAHPGLPQVDITWSALHGWTLRPNGDHSAGLAAWCRSLSVPQVRATLLSGFASCWADTQLGGHDVHLWAAVDDLQRLLVEDQSVGACISEHDGLRLTVADLEYYAEHGTLPEAGGSDA